MHLSNLETRQLSRVFEILTQPEDSLHLRGRLIAPLASLLGADYVASLVWDESTQRFRDGISSADDSKHIEAYQAEHQFSDPLAPLLRARRYPTLVTQVVAQRDLVASDFFQRFLEPGLMYWGLNFYAHDGQQEVGDFRIWRTRSRGNFDAHTLEVLRLIYPSLVSALSGSRSIALAQPPSSPKSPQALDPHIAYQHGLSKREFQVAQCTAQGYSDKEIAKQLGVGFTTVRTYLSQTLKKTACANRKELIAYLCSR